MSSVTGENIAGLVVGEGCFYAESAPDPKYRLGWRIRPAFCVEMRADDREVLSVLQGQLQCGQIYDLDFGRYKGYEARGWHPHAKFRVTRLGDLQMKDVPYFDRYPLFGRKRQAFLIFREIVVALVARKHREPDGLEQVKQLCKRLSEHNGGRPRGAVRLDDLG